MTDAKSARPATTAARAAKRAANPEHKKLVISVSRALWHVYHASDEPKLDADQRKSDWAEHRRTYVQMAAGLVRRLQAQGITLTQSADQTAKGTAAPSRTAKPVVRAGRA